MRKYVAAFAPQHHACGHSPAHPGGGCLTPPAGQNTADFGTTVNLENNSPYTNSEMMHVSQRDFSGTLQSRHRA
jgi:hypothetical protein